MVLTGKPGVWSDLLRQGSRGVMPGGLAALEQRFSVLAPGAMPFRLILSELERHEAVKISIHSFGQRDVITRVYRFLRHSCGQRRKRANVLGDVAGLVHQLVMRNQPLCETHSISFLGAK